MRIDGGERPCAEADGGRARARQRAAPKRGCVRCSGWRLRVVAAHRFPLARLATSILSASIVAAPRIATSHVAASIVAAATAAHAPPKDIGTGRITDAPSRAPRFASTAPSAAVVRPNVARREWQLRATGHRVRSPDCRHRLEIQRPRGDACHVPRQPRGRGHGAPRRTCEILTTSTTTRKRNQQFSSIKYNVYQTDTRRILFEFVREFRVRAVCRVKLW